MYNDALSMLSDILINQAVTRIASQTIFRFIIILISRYRKPYNRRQQINCLPLKTTGCIVNFKPIAVGNSVTGCGSCNHIYFPIVRGVRSSDSTLPPITNPCKLLVLFFINKTQHHVRGRHHGDLTGNSMNRKALEKNCPMLVPVEPNRRPLQLLRRIAKL